MRNKTSSATSLSYQYNAVRLFGDPFQILGPPSGGNGNAAFFPGTGVDKGGILPSLGRFGAPAGLDGVSTISPGGAGRPLVAGLGRQFCFGGDGGGVCELPRTTPAHAADTLK